MLVAAPAKINLYLSVGRRRPDGYHDVETIVQALELHDTVRVERASSLQVTCEPDVGVPAGDNLAARAARALGDALGRAPGFAIDVRKTVPVGAGLGGGSADAAAALVALAHAWGVSAEDPAVASCAASLGADVPFFLGGGCALLRGRGDELVRRLPVPRLHVALVNPGVLMPTAAVYGALGGSAAPAGGSAEILAAIESGDPRRVAGSLHNGMTGAAVSLAPAIAEALAWVSERPGVLGSCMAGSGSTVFGVFRDAASAEAAALAARGRGWWAEATRTRNGGVELLEPGGPEESE